MNLIPVLLYPFIFWLSKERRWRIYTLAGTIVSLPLFVLFQGVEWGRQWLAWNAADPHKAHDLIAALDTTPPSQSLSQHVPADSPASSSSSQQAVIPEPSHSDQVDQIGADIANATKLLQSANDRLSKLALKKAV